MNLSAIKLCWEELQQSTQASELRTSKLNNVDLEQLKSELTQQLNKLLISNTDINKNIGSFSQSTKTLEKIIPDLKGHEQVFYAKLYRVCILVTDYYSQGR